MRLLHATEFRFEEFNDEIPRYVILSHRWGPKPEEATFQDMCEETGTEKRVQSKVRACCDQTVRDGFEWVWIDTCCIDRKNSVELQEAINSMFDWYKRSAICYAYLSDYSAPEGGSLDEESFRACKWFTRGWTLQELIAPSKMVFYDRNWRDLGTKIDLSALISNITQISQDVLGGQDLRLCSIAQRMSWASRREATREEDMSYCLLGLFSVHMPMMYGEGAVAAFIRLQKTIMEQTYDHSLFAWKQEGGCPAHGMLATSPQRFGDASTVVPTQNTKLARAYRMTNRGLEIELRITCTLQGGEYIALLLCEEKESKQELGIHLAIMDDGRFMRTRLDQLADEPTWSNENYSWPVLQNIYVPQEDISETPAQQTYQFEIVRYNDVRRARVRDVFYKDRYPRRPHSIQGRVTSKISLLLNSISERQTVLSRAYYLAFTTSPAQAPPQQLNFTLKAGGRVGVLYRANKFPLTWTDRFTWRRVRLISIIFGVSSEGKIFAHIDGDAEDRFQDWRRGEKMLAHYKHEEKEWLRRYTLDRVPEALSGNRNIELGQKMLYLGLGLKSAEGQLVHEVWLTFAGSDDIGRSIR